jgi:hypothetical protein
MGFLSDSGRIEPRNASIVRSQKFPQNLRPIIFVSILMRVTIISEFVCSHLSRNSKRDSGRNITDQSRCRWLLSPDPVRKMPTSMISAESTVTGSAEGGSGSVWVVEGNDLNHLEQWRRLTLSLCYCGNPRMSYRVKHGITSIGFSESKNLQKVVSGSP